MIIKRIGKILEWGVFGCLAVLVLAVMSPILPTKQFVRSFIVTSGSMAPKVPAGSLVLVHPVPKGAIHVGDIIAFTLPGSPKTTVLHRVSAISKNPLMYHTKGDNNNAADTWSVPASNVIGIFIYGIPYVGYAAAYIRTKLGFGLLIGIPVLYLIYTQIRLIIDGVEEEIQKSAKKALAGSSPFPTNVLPFFVAGLLAGCITALGIHHIEALFSTQATIRGISISAEIGVTPTPTPTPTPSCALGNIVQQNSLTSYTTVTSQASTGNNTIEGNTGGGGNITTGDASASAIVITTGGSNIILCR